jgi:glycosyltransferase involved in cell wall biosynthesis
MIDGLRVAVVLPAYNAGKTLERTYAEIPLDVVDDVILVDDASTDSTAAVAERLGIHTIIHARNGGYGANQKSCYTVALARGADIVVMVHPDYQYSPRLITAMAGMIASGHYDAVFASRILGGGALLGGMPRYKYVANRLLTAFQNLLMGAKLSEYHTGYRAWSRKVLEHLPLLACSDDFVFDNEMIAQTMWAGFQVGEISCPTKYFPEASSINFKRSCIYGLGVLRTALTYRLCRAGLMKSPLFAPAAAKLPRAAGAMPSMSVAEPLKRVRAA